MGKGKTGRAAHFFAMPEMLLEVLSYSDWSTVIAVSRTNTYARTIAQLAVLYRIRSEIAPFVPRSDFLDFMDMLHAVGGGIVGSVARLMLADNSLFLMKRARYNAADLNLVVLPGQLAEAKSFFKRRGYSKWSDVTVANVYKGVVAEVVDGVRPSSPGVTVCIVAPCRVCY
jgi:hypothetical protein